MTRGVFVTGTDTGVGKTVAACALLHALRAAGLEVAAMKPVAAGAGERDGRLVNEDTIALMEAAGMPEGSLPLVTPVMLRAPMAPHVAARLEGRIITRRPILDAFATLSAGGRFCVVEGVGGFRVPLDQDYDTSELAHELGLPVVLVVGLRLGCLNHALLTAQAIAGAKLPLAGWIANGIDPAMAVQDENVEALRERLPAPLLARFPHAAPPDARSLARRIDVAKFA